MEGYDEINKPDKVDAFLALVKATVNFVPGGTYFDEYWITFLGSPLEKRRTEWFQQLYKLVMDLRDG
ncbi:hypothetical protein [Dyadobacter sp. MSC1_007]|jgi:hypothetical protein|uniref:hypothetical protein n=1 Tax=Dyadobacter sp. MSC1_007 TaxID=2909264 RepID=UPI00202FA848|nr:hypothetical protein [Dyadobacter sp. MSC1_007]